ncbi:putative virion stractural protein [Ralstonia phage RSF1]|uniref:Putative virion stractural protein n=1 Tax=Ralstonia phage RSF1 TaxID=1689679 RepID=A0A0K2QQR7_9CAUD|nr:virion structural protein [Ralstonia phage RSF1]BAS04893.1 putative virion stractural protein [Ralstonia phage RSF1]
MSSSVKIVENVANVSNGRKLPVLEFVRNYKPLAAAISKATPGTDRVTRDPQGNRKISSPDYASMISVHRTISRRNKDAKMTLQMLPDLKLALEMVISLIMSPKDMFSDEVLILSDSSELLPASLMSSMLQVTTDYFKKNHNLTEFLQHMLEEVLGQQGALPVAVIPENALDDLINNYNANLSLEKFSTEFDVERNIPHPLSLLGAPDYLTARQNNTPAQAGGRANRMKFGSQVSFDLQSFESYRSTSMNANKATTANAGIAFSKLFNDKLKDEDKNKPWMFKPAGMSALPGSEGDGNEISADNLVFVTDNFSILKLPNWKERARGSRVSEVLKGRGYNKLQASLESMTLKLSQKQKEIIKADAEKGGRQLADSEVESLLFKNRRFAHTPVASIRTNGNLKRNSIGEPMIKEFDTACFIPVSIEGDPTRKLGGFIMLDEEGYPLTTHTPDPEEIVDLSTYAGGSGNFISSMNDRSNSIMNGKDCNGVPQYMLKKFFTRAFAEMVEKDLIDRVKNGQYDNGVQLASNEDFYWLMLTRCMKGQRTHLLWLPNEFLVYFAMDYDEMGFGKSLLDDIRNITSMRIMLMVSGIAASLKNSIGRTKVTVKLDEEDPDAEKSIEDIQDEILKSRMNPIPFGINNVADISKYLQRSCYEFEISGSNAIPDMQVQFEQYNSQYPKPDEDLQNQLKELSIHHFGLTKDMIDAAEGVDFAIQAATNNLMTMKRVQRWQRKVEPQASEYIRKIAINSESQINDLRDLVRNNFDQLQVEKIKRYFGLEDDKMLEDEDFKKLVTEQCLNVFLNNLVVELPSPASATLEAQKQQFDDAAEFYKNALEYIVNESFFDASVQGEEMSNHVDMIKNILLSHFMREYMAKNAILPELADLTTIGEDGKIAVNIMDSLEQHIKALGMSTGNFFKRFKQFAALQSALMQDVADSTTEGETDTGGGSSGGDDFGGGGGTDDDIPGLDDIPDETEEDTDTTTSDTDTGTGDQNANPDENEDEDENQ